MIKGVFLTEEEYNKLKTLTEIITNESIELIHTKSSESNYPDRVNIKSQIIFDKARQISGIIK